MDNSLHEIRLQPTRPGERLEIALSYPPVVTPGGVVLCSPHPFLGGDLDNNVLRQLARALATTGRPVLRFNYRSVGRSHPVKAQTQRYDYWQQVEQEQRHEAVLEDAEEALGRAARLFEPRLLCGYSFGAFVALELSRRLAPQLPLVLIAPPLSWLDFTGLERRDAPTLLLLAEDDEFESPPRAAIRNGSLGRAGVTVIAEANHFFLGQEALVAVKVIEFLDRTQLLEQIA